MLNKTLGLWNYKPVQLGLKTFAAGSVFALTMFGINKVRASFAGPEDLPLRNLQEKVLGTIKEDLEFIWMHDRAWIDLLARLETFRRFDNVAFDELVKNIKLSLDSEEPIASGSYQGAIQSFKVRSKLQKVIESLRIFRAIVELRVPIEDFDEIAADFNAYVEQLCSDAIQNSYA